MAILPEAQEFKRHFADQIGNDLAPEGVYVATVLDLVDEYGVTVLDFETKQPRKVDQETILLGFRDAQGNPHKIATRPMTITSSDKGNLFHFIKAATGKPPAKGFATESLKGAKVQITIEHKARRKDGSLYASIAQVSRVASQPAPAPAPKPQPAPAPGPAAQPEDDQVPF